MPRALHHPQGSHSREGLPTRAPVTRSLLSAGSAETLVKSQPLRLTLCWLRPQEHKAARGQRAVGTGEDKAVLPEQFLRQPQLKGERDRHAAQDHRSTLHPLHPSPRFCRCTYLTSPPSGLGCAIFQKRTVDQNINKPSFPSEMTTSDTSMVTRATGKETLWTPHSHHQQEGMAGDCADGVAVCHLEVQPHLQNCF